MVCCCLSRPVLLLVNGTGRRSLVKETEEVARAEAGYEFDLVEKTLEVALKTGGNRNSMLLDLEAGKRTEIDFLNCAVVQFARRHNLHAPINMSLAQIIKGKEEIRGYGWPCPTD